MVNSNMTTFKRHCLNLARPLAIEGTCRPVSHTTHLPCRSITFTSTRLWSSASPTPKRPSPYRLIPLPTFLADFAPLHVKGWCLELLPGLHPDQRPQDEGMAQLQDRRLVRRYDFEQGKDGWRKLIGFTQTIGDVVEKEDVRLCHARAQSKLTK
jgi:hypothetical protein